MLSAELHKGNREATAGESYGRSLYNRFRYYDASTGRYISADPLGVGGVNAYAYARLNPLSFTDYFGLDVDQVKQRWNDAIDRIHDNSPPSPLFRGPACNSLFGGSACEADMEPFFTDDPSQHQPLCDWCEQKRVECIRGGDRPEGDPPDITPESNVPDFTVNPQGRPRGIGRRGPKVPNR